METKLNKIQMERVRRSFGFFFSIDVSVDSTRGGLSLAWKSNFSISLQSFSSQHIDVEIKDLEINTKWLFTGFYSTLYAINRMESWNVLCGLG